MIIWSLIKAFSSPSNLLVINFEHFPGEVKDGYLHIGETSVPVSVSDDAAAMVPNVLFYDNELVRE